MKKSLMENFIFSAVCVSHVSKCLGAEHLQFNPNHIYRMLELRCCAFEITLKLSYCKYFKSVFRTQSNTYDDVF